MRPISLTLKAFGSYPGEHTIDFAALGQRGLFLITGPTGSGKTTIFDTMTWALYGELPGTRDQKGEVRSHHVADTVETYAELTFEAGGRLYRVRRNEEWQRAKERGTGTTMERSSAALFRLDADAVIPLETKLKDVSKACERLVGLSADEFQRVVLLPQGKFTEFLLANEKGREDLLSNLFRGKLYRDATAHLGDQVKTLTAEVKDIESSITHHRANAISSLQTVAQHWEPNDADGNPTAFPESPDDAWLTGCIAKFKPVDAAKRAEIDTLESAATGLEQRAATANADAGRFDAAETLRSTITALEDERTDREADAGAVASSQRGRPVQTATQQRDHAKQKLDEADNARKNVTREVHSGFASLQSALPSPLTAMAVSAQLQAFASGVTAKLDKIQTADEAEDEATEAETAHASAVAHQTKCSVAHEAARKRRDKLVVEIQGLDPLADQVDARKAKVDAAEDRVQHREKLEKEQSKLPAAIAKEAQAKDAAVQAGKRFVDTQAPRLAKDLKNSEPCSVCGSKTHPAPALTPAGKAFEFADLKTAQNTHQAAASALAGIQATVQQLATTLGPEALRTVEEVRQDHADLKAKFAEAVQANRTRKGLQGDLKLAEQAFTSTAEALQHAQVGVASAQTTAESARTHANTLAEEVADYDATALHAQQATLVTLSDIGERLAIAENNVNSTQGALANAESTLTEALQASGFADIAVALAAVLNLADETMRATRHQKWADDMRDAKAKLGALEAQVIPELRPDAEGQAETARLARESANRGLADFTTASNALTAAATELDRAQSIGSASAAKRQALADARTVFETCNGRAGIKVTLERWVLSGELQRVATAANVHLARMSSGRYRIGRKEGTSSLELEVFDAHTGKARSPASLSGGEQFQASLSLALGMADVISQGGTGGGQQFEALFVDEGFGSLDAQALDDAISALEKIQSTGRMVGAITHVEAMKERLPVGISVEPNADGRGSKLRMGQASA